MKLLYEVMYPALAEFMEAEQAHDLAKSAFRYMEKSPTLRGLANFMYEFRDERLHATLPARSGDVKLENPIILAAGFDKDAELFTGMSTLGFGGIEVGSFTYESRVGNPKPRIFRLQEDKALINWMGLPGQGTQVIVDRFKYNVTTPVFNNMKYGINIAKSPSAEDGIEDIRKSLELTEGYGHWKTVNVSCPNTGESIEEQSDELAATMESAREAAGSTPLYFKLSPDLDDDALKFALKLGLESKVDGFVLGNTSTRRKEYNLKSELTDEQLVKGGLSGKPILNNTLDTVFEARKLINDRAGIIAGGGISSYLDVCNAIYAGADAVQLYSSFVYGGPGIVKQIKMDLLKTFEKISTTFSIKDLISARNSYMMGNLHKTYNLPQNFIDVRLWEKANSSNKLIIPIK